MERVHSKDLSVTTTRQKTSISSPNLCGPTSMRQEMPRSQQVSVTAVRMGTSGSSPDLSVPEIAQEMLTNRRSRKNGVWNIHSIPSTTNTEQREVNLAQVYQPLKNTTIQSIQGKMNQLPSVANIKKKSLCHSSSLPDVLTSLQHRHKGKIIGMVEGKRSPSTPHALKKALKHSTSLPLMYCRKVFSSSEFSKRPMNDREGSEYGARHDNVTSRMGGVRPSVISLLQKNQNAKPVKVLGGDRMKNRFFGQRRNAICDEIENETHLAAARIDLIKRVEGGEKRKKRFMRIRGFFRIKRHYRPF